MGTVDQAEAKKALSLPVKDKRVKVDLKAAQLKSIGCQSNKQTCHKILKIAYHSVWP